MVELKPKDVNTWRYRLVSLYPTLFTLLLLIGVPIILPALGHTKIAIAIILILSFNWFIRAIVSLISALIGLYTMHKNKKIPWERELKKLIKNWKGLPAQDTLPEDWERFKLAIFIPVYKEPYALLKRTLNALSKTRFDRHKLTIVFAAEERGGEQTLQRLKKLKKELAGQFHDILIYVHPANIPGEVIGIAGPNLSWAARRFSEYLNKHNIKSRNVLALKFDSDTVVPPNFLPELVYRYLTCEQRYKRYFFPITIIYSNNIWRVPFFSRAFWMIFSFILLAESNINLRKTMSFSTYAFSFKLLEDIGFWETTIGIDDTMFFTQAYLYHDTDFSGCPVYTPVYMDAVEGNGFFDTAKALFKQQIRWGAGAAAAPIILSHLLNKKGKNIPLAHRIWRTLHLLELYSLNTTASFLLAFGAPIISLIASYVSFLISGVLIPELLVTSLTWASKFGILVAWIYFYLYVQANPPKKKYLYVWYFIRAQLDLLLLPLNAMLFNMIPYIYAQLKILAGKYGNFYVVQKVAA